MAMFRTAATKIAHNSTMPALAGNKDLRPLQDLITAEKAVLNSLQRLSVDITKASDALKVWGLGEGDDLGDTLSASTALYLHYAAALSAFANHEITVREQMKSLRSREEGYDELRRRRRQLAAKADAAEKKLSKMRPDNKNMQEQTSQLDRLRDDIRIMDTDIMAEEASLGDYKRSTARSWMGIKFGGLLECAQRGVIVGDLGKLVIAEIPLDHTDPGLPRAAYAGHARTEYLVATGQRAVNEIFFSSDPSHNPLERPIRPLAGFELPPAASPQQNKPFGYVEYPLPGEVITRSRPGSMSMSSVPLTERPPSTSSRFSSPLTTGYTAGYGPDAPSSPTLSMPTAGDGSEFGMLTGQYSPRVVASARSPDERERFSGAHGGRFSTFPHRPIGARPLSTAGVPPNGAYAPPMVEGDRVPSLEVAQPQDDFSSSVAQALGTQWTAPDGSGASHALRSVLDMPGDTKHGSISSQRSYEPPPMYEPLAGLPPGAAPAQPPQGGSWSGHMLDERGGVAGGSQMPEDQDEVRLAYSADESDVSPGAGEDGDRRVRFEDSSNTPETETPERNGHAQESTEVGTPGVSQSPPANIAAPQPQRQPEPSTDSIPPRLPTPGSDDRSLNAAAAREVSRELDALMFSSPKVAPASVDRSPSPLAPPQAPFSQRSVSPRPNVAISTPPMNPGGSSLYMRERDRSLVSPTSPTSSGDHATSISSSASRAGGDVRAGSNLRSPPSPSPSAVSNGTPYRTPPDSVASPVISTSMYSLPAAARGSGTSVSTPTAGGTRTISAAAFRRVQMRNASTPALDSPPSADTGPLQVKKRALPSSPYPPSTPRMASSPPPGSGGVDGSGPDQRYRSASAQPQNGGSRTSASSGRPSGEHAEEEGEEYDYISAYVNSPAKADDETSPRRTGYGQGQYSTSLNDERDIGGLR
ncbi:hypothetical protein B0H21DRAFT_461366 [Amylocystis lapponica]|nr:hypothetical protein B0H21DRAFT_461366 [Amylocystis lapponica]